MDKKWFCGVTTAPRSVPTLQRSIDSLVAAGWVPHVRAEPRSAPATNCIVADNEKKLGVWHNWLALCRDAVVSDADYFLLCQDDIDVHPQSKVICEMFFRYPSRGPFSLYTPDKYTGSQPGIRQVMFSNLWGAVAFAWRRKDIEELLADPICEEWLGAIKYPKQRAVALRDSSLIANSDVAIGQVIKKKAWSLWSPTPSLTGHTATVSSIPGHGSNEIKRNRNARKIADKSKPITPQIWPNGIPNKYRDEPPPSKSPD